MYLSGLISRPMTADDDYKLLDIGIGFTNIVERTTRGSGNLTRKEIVGGTKALVGKIKECKPKIAVFNGKGIYEIFSGKKDFHLGKQPEKIDGTDTVRMMCARVRAFDAYRCKLNSRLTMMHISCHAKLCLLRVE